MVQTSESSNKGVSTPVWLWAVLVVSLLQLLGSARSGLLLFPLWDRLGHTVSTNTPAAIPSAPEVFVSN